MLKSISLQQLYCFASDQKLENLDVINYIYGPNGSGKTTISAALNDPGASALEPVWKGDPQTIKVYNRNYVQDTLASTMPGVFSLGEESKQIVQKIKELTDKSKDIADKKTWQQQDINSTKESRDKLEAEAADQIWNRLADFPYELRQKMKGLNRSKKDAFSLIIRHFKDSTKPNKTDLDRLNLDDLKSRAEKVFSSTLHEVGTAPPVPQITWKECHLADSLQTPVTSTADVPLKTLIDELDNSDWVRQGKTYLEAQEKHPPKCPFCQKETDNSLREQLSRLFDKHYEHQIASIKELHQEVNQFYEQLQEYHKNYLNIGIKYSNHDSFEASFKNLQSALLQALQQLEKKISTPAMIYDNPHLAGHYQQVLQHSSQISTEIEAHNNLARNQNEEKNYLIDQSWTYLIWITLKHDLQNYLKKKDGLDKKIGGLEKQVNDKIFMLQKLEEDIKSLQSKTASSQYTIDKINELLKVHRFHSFKLKKAPNPEQGYQIVRSGGAIADSNTLSEGERTFLTFLYFYHSLEGQIGEGETPRLCAVIDDPISSLDADIMFVVSALIRNMIRLVQENEHDRVDQILILTHNTRFHQEVTYASKERNNKNSMFYRIKKLSPAPNEIEACGHRNPVRSSYQELWDQVADAISHPDKPMPWLANTLRRILESYFMALGGYTDLYSLADKLSQAQRMHHHALVAWSHRGSHRIIDDTIFAPIQASNQDWLNAFENIFSRASNGAHLGHYKMMLAEAKSPSEVAVNQS